MPDRGPGADTGCPSHDRIISGLEPGTVATMPYDLGNPELDALVAQLVAGATTSEHADLIAEMIVTSLKLGRDGASKADLKLINTALKEMRYSNLVFARHEEPKVTIYGSARIGEDDPNYHLTADFAATMAESGWGVITIPVGGVDRPC